MKKYELVNELASTLASKDDIVLQDASPAVQNKYISSVLMMFATLESLEFDVVPSGEQPEYKNETMMESILHTWCEKLSITPNWPKKISLEEKLDRYLFPLLKEDLNLVEKDREYYQNRFYLMQWAFRKFLKTYGEVTKELQFANIRFLIPKIFDENDFYDEKY